MTPVIGRLMRLPLVTLLLVFAQWARAEDNSPPASYILDIDIESIDASDALADVIITLHRNGLLPATALRGIEVMKGDTANKIFRDEFGLPAVTPKLKYAIQMINPALGSLDNIHLGDVIKVPAALKRTATTRVFSQDQRAQYERLSKSVPSSLQRDLWSSERIGSLVRVDGERFGTGFIVNGLDGRQYVITSTRVLTGSESLPPSSDCAPLDIRLASITTGKPIDSHSCAHYLGEDVSLIPLPPPEGHSDAVYSVAFSSDGQRMLSGGLDGTVRLSDAASGKLLHTFKGHSDGVYSVAFSPDGQRMLSGGLVGTVRLWDAASGGELLRTFEGYSVAFSPDGQRMLSGGLDGTVRLWDAASGKLLHTFKGHSGAVNSVAFSPDGQRMLSAGLDGTLRLWDVATRELLHTFKGHSGSVNSVAFSPNGQRMLSAGLDGIVRLWDVASGRLLRTFEGHSGSVNSVAFSPDGQRMLSGGLDGTVRLWDAATGQLVLQMPQAGLQLSAREVVFGDLVSVADIHRIDQEPVIVGRTRLGASGEIAFQRGTIRDVHSASGAVVELPTADKVLAGAPVLGPDGLVVGIITGARARYARMKPISQMLDDLGTFIPRPSDWLETSTQFSALPLWGYNLRIQTNDLNSARRSLEALLELERQGVRSSLTLAEPSAAGTSYALSGGKKLSKKCTYGEEVSYLELLPWREDWLKQSLPEACFKREHWPTLVLIDQPIFDHAELSDSDGSIVTHLDKDRRPMSQELVDKLPEFADARKTPGVVFDGTLANRSTKKCVFRDFDGRFDHGTHLAGIIASRRGNSESNKYGFSGILPGLKLISIPGEKLLTPEMKVLLKKLANQSQDLTGPQRIMLFASPFPFAGLDRDPIGALRPNYSLRSAPSTQLAKEEYRISGHPVARWVMRDLSALWVVAAGQHVPVDDTTPEPLRLLPRTPQAPQNLGDLPHVIVVTACKDCGGADETAELWPNANRADEAKPEMVPVAAPGIDVPSTVVGSSYATTSGTSVAAALVAGVSAAMTACYSGVYKRHPGVLKEQLILTGRPYLFRPKKDNESWQTVSATVVVDPQLALSDPGVDWLVEGPSRGSATRRSVKIKGWCVDQLPIENADGSNSSLQVEELRRLTRWNNMWVSFSAQKKTPSGPFEMAVDDPQAPLLITDDDEIIRRGSLIDIFLKKPRGTASCEQGNS